MSEDVRKLAEKVKKEGDQFIEPQRMLSRSMKIGVVLDAATLARAYLAALKKIERLEKAGERMQVVLQTYYPDGSKEAIADWDAARKKGRA